MWTFDWQVYFNIPFTLLRVSCVVQDDLELMIFLPKPFKSWDYRHALPFPSVVVKRNVKTCSSQLTWKNRWYIIVIGCLHWYSCWVGRDAMYLFTERVFSWDTIFKRYTMEKRYLVPLERNIGCEMLKKIVLKL